jgi:chromate transporter
LAAAAFLAIYSLQIPFPVIVIAAGLIGAFFAQSDTQTFDAPDKITLQNSLKHIALWGALWGAPIVLVVAMDHNFLTDIALFFSQLAIVTFGGAYAVLAYMTQTVSFDYGWITTGEMIDALGLAETTPGPLILVTEFVALLAGYKEAGLALMLAAGALALWCTFIPCFLWIFMAAPYVEWLLAQPRLKAALQSITAAVVGVIFNLSLWFALHVLFSKTVQTQFGLFPDLQSIDVPALLLLILAALLLIWRQLSLPIVLAICAIAGVFLSFLL